VHSIALLHYSTFGVLQSTLNKMNNMSTLVAEMPKSDKTKRIEAHLLPEIVEQLQKLAKSANRSLKNYIETLLIEHVKDKKNKA
jgi:hypothetical protein